MAAIDSTKPFAGVLNGWIKVEYLDDHYGYIGTLEQDARQRRGFDGASIRTSAVVNEDGNYVETRNSIYVLGEKAKEVDHGSVEVYN